MNKVISFIIFSFWIFTNNTIAQIAGCTDYKAINYNELATNNDGSCTYNLDTITPTSSFELDDIISETSGLILWNDFLWTHNDSGGETNIYALDTLDGSVIKTVPLPGTSNIDWEEISQDNDFIYIGDFGNNVNGIRTDLKILRVSKSSILADAPVIDTIHFSYSNQIIDTASGANNTDFDCEAFIVSTDSIYLFSKQWVIGKTSVYALPKIPGTFVASLKSTWDVQGLITGAVYLESKKIIALCGYNKSLKPFMYLLYDFTDSDFFSGNKRKLLMPLSFHQVEGITTTNGLKYYVSNEEFPQLNVLPKLHVFDLSSFLDTYLDPSLLTTSDIELDNKLTIYPVPSSDFVVVNSTESYLNESYVLINQLGQVVLSDKLTSEKNQIDISSLNAGIYVLKIGNFENIKVVKE